MEWLTDLGIGMLSAVQPAVFVAALLGVIIGVIIGVIPGLGPAVAMSLAIPLTFTLSPAIAISLLLGIYKGGTYGGSISAILINTPGTPAAAATILDGYPLAKQGKAGKALHMALYASVCGDAVSIMLLLAVAQPLASIALMFGPPELFSLLLFAWPENPCCGASSPPSWASCWRRSGQTPSAETCASPSISCTLKTDSPSSP